MKKIKIIFVFGALGGGGAQRQFGHLISNIDKGKFETIILSIGTSKQSADSFIENNLNEDTISKSSSTSYQNFSYYYLYPILKDICKIIFIESKKYNKLQNLIKIYNVFKEESPDIIFYISPFAALMAAVPSLFFKNIIKIHSIRSNEILLSHHLSVVNILLWLNSFFTSYYTVNSEELKKKMINSKYLSKKIFVIYNGIPIFFDKKDFIRKNSKVIIAYIARFHKIKNHSFFLDVIKSIKRKENFEVHFYGTGYLEQELRRKVDELKLKDVVSFKGWVEDVSSILPEIDIVVLTSTGEGFNNSIAEAQMHGIPVVTTQCTGSAEIVIEGKTGFVIPIDNQNLYVQKLELLIKDHNLRKTFAQQAYLRSRNTFTIKKMVTCYEDLFSNLNK